MAYKRISPIVIAEGGTNATSMATSTGIVKYDGTSLVTSSTAKIDSSNRQTNTSQPCFEAVLSTVHNNVTGNGTVYNIICDTSLFDQASNYNATTGIFTAPIAGKYMFCMSCTVTNTNNATNMQVRVITTSNTYINTYNRQASTANLNLNLVCVASMAASDTAKIQVETTGSGSDNNTVYGDNTTGGTLFSGYLLC